MKKREFYDIKNDIIIWIASWAVVWLVFMIWDWFSDLARLNWLWDGWAFLIKAVISSLWILFLMKYFDIKKFK